MIRCVELFAGVGGFRLGLEAASPRYRTIWSNQWEPSMHEQYAYECYVKHFGKSTTHVCEDIATAKARIPEHDLLVGGFPCQDYSIMKKNSAGIEGKKGVLWWQIDSILRERRPKFVLLENVDRLLRSPGKQKGRDFSIILRCFYEKGYAVEWRVINAAEYGCAQRRRRTFIIAYHNQTDRFRTLAEGVCTAGLKYMHSYVMQQAVLAKAFPIATHSRTYSKGWIDEMAFPEISDISNRQRFDFNNAGVMMNGRVYSVDVIPKQEKAIPIGDVLERRPLADSYFIRDEELPGWRYLKGEKCEKRRRRDGSEYVFTEGQVAFPEPLGRPSRTMLTSEGQYGRATHVVIDPLTSKLRILTPIECERLNSFPDRWTDTGMPERMRYFCMGNALVVSLITRIGKALLDEFGED